MTQNFPTGMLQFRQLRLTSAQLIAASTTPVMIVQAPGPRQIISLLQSFYELIFGTVPYTEASAGSLYYGPTATVNADAGGDQSVFNRTVSSACSGYTFSQVSPIVSIEGKGLYFKPGALSGGDGSAKISVWYMVLPAY